MAGERRNLRFQIAIRTIMVVTAVCAFVLWARRSFGVIDTMGFVVMLLGMGLYLGFAWARALDMEGDAVL
jgi:hypothetical protein